MEEISRIHHEGLAFDGRIGIVRVVAPLGILAAAIRHGLAPESDAAQAGIVAARSRFASGAVEFIGEAKLSAETPLGRDPTGIDHHVVSHVVERARVLIEYFSLPCFTVVVAIEHHTIAPGVIDHEGEAVVVGGFHPIANVGTKVNGIIATHIRQDFVLLVPCEAAVLRTEVVKQVVGIASGDNVDDVAVGARGHHVGPAGVDGGVEVAQVSGAARGDGILVFD